MANYHIILSFMYSENFDFYSNNITLSARDVLSYSKTKGGANSALSKRLSGNLLEDFNRKVISIFGATLASFCRGIQLCVTGRSVNELYVGDLCT